jgi:shikimate kinase
MKIILIGFMGSGKTSVGIQLAKNLAYDFVDTDDLVSQAANMSIPMIFERHGETHFRELEIEVARSLRKRSNVVIATGGGMVINNLCIQYLTENKGRVLYLESSFREISERVAKQAVERPLFKDSSVALKLYEFRKQLYRQYSDNIIYTDEMALGEVVSKALTLYEVHKI